jgi:hypothetical protein
MIACKVRILPSELTSVQRAGFAAWHASCLTDCPEKGQTDGDLSNLEDWHGFAVEESGIGYAHSGDPR